MKKLHSFALYALMTPAITIGAGTLLAQPANQDNGREQRNMPRDQASMEHRGFLDSIPANGIQGSDLLGAEVRTTAEENIGSVNELIIDESGQIVAVVVGVGGFLGMGERDVAVGWDDITRVTTDDENIFRVDLSRDDLRMAPEFERLD